MSNDTQGDITLWHKGGDWVKKVDLKVIVSNPNNQFDRTYTYQDPSFVFVPDPREPTSTVFDLGGNVTVITKDALEGNTTVTLATDRAVLFTGVIGGEPQ